MSENPRRGRQARNFTANVPKILDLKSSSEQIFFRKLSLGAPEGPESFIILRSFVSPSFDPLAYSPLFRAHLNGPYQTKPPITLDII